jgi:hypothetical protein
MPILASPADLTFRVLAAVADGAWTSADVTATVTSELRAERCDVVATLWDLVESGDLTCTHDNRQFGFRVVRPLQTPAHALVEVDAGS